MGGRVWIDRKQYAYYRDGMLWMTLGEKAAPCSVKWNTCSSSFCICKTHACLLHIKPPEYCSLSRFCFDLNLHFYFSFSFFFLFLYFFPFSLSLFLSFSLFPTLFLYPSFSFSLPFSFSLILSRSRSLSLNSFLFPILLFREPYPETERDYQIATRLQGFWMVSYYCHVDVRNISGTPSSSFFTFHSLSLHLMSCP